MNGVYAIVVKIPVCRPGDILYFEEGTVVNEDLKTVFIKNLTTGYEQYEIVDRWKTYVEKHDIIVTDQDKWDRICDNT